jgi:hypothetical protein
VWDKKKIAGVEARRAGINVVNEYEALQGHARPLRGTRDVTGRSLWPRQICSRFGLAPHMLYRGTKEFADDATAANYWGKRAD